ncbi:hypothetical protein AB0907_24220 [Streptomyces sp. NPDC006975]|uniref:hypothetical protein n=1 Tax=Streptomyces sp. NPDC006975 TaxID=3154310 RepID=UPI003453528F
MVCPYGGCDAFGYCPCAEDPPDEEAAGLLDDLAEGRALLLRGRVRPIHTLPPLDDYHPQGS